MWQPGTGNSIVRTASAGFRLSLLLNAASCQISQSGIEIHSIAKGVSLFACSLKQTGQAIQEADLDHSLIDKSREIANEGQRVFDEIENMLELLRSTDSHESLRNILLSQRVKWCFKRHHVTYLLAYLESLKLSLMVMLKIMQVGKLMNTLSPSRSEMEETIAQERAEAQNMIIVRYWSAKRLSRLWEPAEHEAVEAANDKTNQLINYHCSTMTSLAAGTDGGRPIKYTPIALGNFDAELSTMERSPKDMVQLSSNAVESLLSTWFPSLGNSTPHARTAQGVDPWINVAPGGDENNNNGLDGTRDRGYYLEGTTVDWRKPHSQDARNHAARLREQYSKYQAHVDSDSEGSECTTNSRRSARNDNVIFGNGDDVGLGQAEQHSLHRGQREASANMNNIAQDINAGFITPPSSFDERHMGVKSNGTSSIPIQDARLPPQGPFQSMSFPPPQHHRMSSKPAANTSHPMSSNQVPPPLKTTSRASRGTSSVHFKVPSTTLPQGQQRQVHPMASPSSSATSQSFPSSHEGTPPRRSSPRDETTKERHKSLARRATKGLVGISAIAGFMDALEAFSVI